MVDDLPISEEEKRAIFEGNARRLFGLGRQVRGTGEKLGPRRPPQGAHEPTGRPPASRWCPCGPRPSSYDVAILGGGLAGLTLAIQLKQQRPRQRRRAREARGPGAAGRLQGRRVDGPAGAHYFADVVGMRDHLKQRHLIKCGLRFFLPADDNARHHQAVRARPREYPPAGQLPDRPRPVRERAGRASAAGSGSTCCRAAASRTSTSGPTRTRSRSPRHEADTSRQARWVVDAAGRASLLKRKLGLAKDVTHTINSSWLRLGGGLDLEHWGADDEAWMARDARAGLPPVQHEPPAGRGLLGLDDPARVRADQHRRLRRSALPSVRGDQRARRHDRLAARARAASSRATIEPRLGRHRGLPPGRGLRLRRRAGVLHRPLGARRRGGRVRGPVLLTRAPTSSATATCSPAT